MTDLRSALRPAPDQILIDIADYVLNTQINSDDAYHTARYALMDSIGCALLALQFPACKNLLGPVVPGAEMSKGVRVPGTAYQLDPVHAAFNIGCMIRWLDFNDTWLAAEWGHPSDNLGGLLAITDYVGRQQHIYRKPLFIRDLLTAMIKAYEIQGILALENSFNRVGIDHVILVKVATTAVVTALLGGNREQVISALSNAWLDGGTLRTYRHAPNTGPRKSWAAGDATSRGVRLALMAIKNEMGYPSALSAKNWGFYDTFFNGQAFKIQQYYGHYVMENILFKVAHPAEFHAQTAVEAALTLHLRVKNRLGDIEKIMIETQEAGMRIIDKTGPLHNPADRDHCMQYMVAIPLIFGRLVAEDYEDKIAADPRIDVLRSKMVLKELPLFTESYYDENKRAIPNAIQIFFNNGEKTSRVEVFYPIGHRQRRDEAFPLLVQKFSKNISQSVSEKCQTQLVDLLENASHLDQIQVNDFMDWLTIPESFS